jgi:hypothetical protein
MELVSYSRSLLFVSIKVGLPRTASFIEYLLTEEFRSHTQNLLMSHVSHSPLFPVFYGFLHCQFSK